MLKNIAIADLKYLCGRPFLIVFLLVPVLFVSVLKLIYPLISDLLEALFRLDPEHWFTLAVISIISSIPIITGMVFDSINKGMNKYSEVYQENIKLLSENSFGSFLFTFFIVILCSIIANPVPSEGWLRLVFVALLFSLFSIYVLLILNRYLNKVNHLNIYILCVFFLICVPLGMISSKPWNYIGFLSPLYWINWAWIFPNRTESILSGMFAIIYTAGAISPLMVILYRKKTKRI